MFKIFQVGLFALLLLVSVNPAQGQMAQGREDNPLQTQINAVSGGYTFGYHLTNWLYFGVSQMNPKTADMNTSYSGYEPYDQSGLETTSLGYSQKKMVEFRISPWAIGFFVSLGYISAAEETNTYTYDERERVIGENTYTTGFSIDRVTEAEKVSSIGVGFNHVTKSGFTFGVAMNAGTQVAVSSSTVKDLDTSVSAADSLLFQEEITANHISIPTLMFHAGIGWAF
ncbi:MAG: hypothetical protein QNL04_08965 [SAR324 cluster bacterium]|nr:hypothetical protein [SAR324 cluster bacterium]